MIGYVKVVAVLSLVGTLIKWLSVPLAGPLVLALVEGRDVLPFAVSVLVSAGVGWALEQLDPDPDLGIREGFLIVGLSWVGVALVGALPYILAGRGTLAHPMNALFESMSGFTTTGATMLATFEEGFHSRALMMWRQISQWLGGMGIVVLGVAVLPKLSVGGAQLMEAEAPGPGVEKLTPRIAETARRLWILYVLITVVEIVWMYGLHLFGWAPRMDLFQAVAHAFTTMPTGGFSPQGRSIEAFSSAVQWSMCPFIFLAGTNFALLWRACTGRPRLLFEDREFWFYGFMVVLFSGLMGVLLWWQGWFGEWEASIRHGLFQVLSIITTTGYASVDFAAWGGISDSVLFVAMFLGACAGSTGGGIKMIRWLVTLKTLSRELYTSVHPDALRPLRLGGKVLAEPVIRGMLMMVLFYMVVFLSGTVLLGADAIRTGHKLSGLGLLSAAASCLGNIGPGFGSVGPMENYLVFSHVSKSILIVLMWIGRLEVLTVMILLTPSYWRR